MKNISKLAIFGMILALLAGVGCEPIEPVSLEDGLVIDESCDRYQDTIYDALTYIDKNYKRGKYYASDLRDWANGTRSWTLICRPLVEGVDVGGFAQAQKKNGNYTITVDVASVLDNNWYHFFFKKLHFSGKAVFTAGILFHEMTHLEHFRRKLYCEGETEPTINQYELWSLGNLLSTSIGCFDGARRGCTETDHSRVKATFQCVADRL